MELIAQLVAILSLFSLNVSNCWVTRIVSLILIIQIILLLKKLSTLPSPKSSFVGICPSIMIVLGSGGHTWEMFKMLSLFKPNFNYLPNYVVANDDILSENYAKYFETNFARRFSIDKVTRPRHGSEESILSFNCLLNSFKCFFKSIKLIVSHQPDYIISNGPSTCVPVMLAAWLLNSLRLTKISLIYVESMARVNSLSISARFLRPFVTDMFSLWHEMCDMFQLSPLASVALNKVNSLTLRNDEKMIRKTSKTIFVTVGTTEFDELVTLTFGQQFQSTLINLGFSEVIVQVGLRSQYDGSKDNFTVLPQLQFKIVSIVNEGGYRDILRNSDLIVSHGGAGTLIQALELNKSIIAVLNPKTVGNHQGELINYLKEKRYIHSCDVVGLIDCLRNDFVSQPLNYSLKFNHLSDAFLRKIFRNSIELGLSDENNVNDVIKDKFSIVIPSTIENESQLKTLLKSLKEFLDIRSVDRVFIIVPERDVKNISNLVASLAWNHIQLRIVSEVDLISESVLSLCNNQLKSRSGWFKQQILKLKAADIVRTDFYLILDSDCILRCPVTYNDLITTNHQSGRKRAYLQTEEVFKHPKWYKGSAKLLGITNPFMKGLKGCGIGVTPQVLSVYIVKRLTNFLQVVHQLPWPILLANNRFQIFPPANWTEFTLYFLYAERTGLLGNYHVLRRNIFANYHQSVWTNDQVKDWHLKSNNFSSVAPFVIFQSNLGLGGEAPSTFLENIIAQNYSKVTNRRSKKVYVICSELEFYPVVGGINTFIRAIISSFQELMVKEQNIEFVFCGLKCGDSNSSKEFPDVSGISFKFFSTPRSVHASDLANYFKSSTNFSTLISDLQEFGRKCTNWILSDCQTGDACVTTIVYELNVEMIENLINSGLTIVHTVHSLVARKAISTFRAVPTEKLHFLDRVRVTVLKYVFYNENNLMRLCQSKCLSWAIPKILSESLNIEKCLIENSNCVFVPSTLLTEFTSSLYAKAKDRIHYVPWGLPKGQVLGDYFQLDESSTQIDNVVNCLALCKLIPQKGIDVLLDAMKKIEQIDVSLSRRIKLKICGDMAYMNVSTYLSGLKNQCKSLKHIDVEFTGWLEGQAKYDVMSQAHLLLVSSITEPFGFCVIEAMKMGMGVISFETEGPSDIIRPSFGRLVPLNYSNEVMATGFALAIIDICYSKAAANGFQEINEAAKCAANNWNMQAFFETLLSIV